MGNTMTILPLSDVDISDAFFDTLRGDYPGFDGWFKRKASNGESAYVNKNNENQIDGFLYLKTEDGIVDDVTPTMPSAKRLKIGTFKIDAHGTKLGERFIKKVFDEAIVRDVDQIYVTVFEKHTGLTRLFDKYGFQEVGTKASADGGYELVMSRDMRVHEEDLVKHYPYIFTSNVRKYLLAIQPKWHTQLLPDSILNNENFDILQDLSHTNSIHKVYICFMRVDGLRRGDILVMYRTKDESDPGTAEYRSVATSVCVIEDIRHASHFETEAAFLTYCGPHSVFSESELKDLYRKNNARVIKFTYNAAMSKRLIRKHLIECVGLEREQYWGFFQISDEQFARIVSSGGVNENLIVN